MRTVLILLALITVSSSEMSSTGGVQACKNLAVSCKGFTNDFHKVLSTSLSGNIVSSPLSVHMILSLLSNGAEGTTLDELVSGLRHQERNSLNDEFKTLISVLNDVKDVKLYIANAMYIQDGLQVFPEFLSTGRDVFQSLMSQLDFKNAVAATKTINDWIKETTNGKISELISSDDVNEFTQMVLVNAIYFKGHWLHPFNVKDTEKKAFHVTKTEKKFVPTMFKKSTYDHGELTGLNARFIEIPYLNKDITMIIILPNEVDGLQSLERNFEWSALAEAPRDSDTLELYLPRFEFEVTVNLEDTLREMGLNTMFENNADFSRISRTELKVSKVLHKAVIEVNEEGTEAAAASSVQIRLRRMIVQPEQFLVDRPFMFLIEHKPSNIPLFIGSVRDIKTSPGRDEL